jgi:hypothetical protein
MSEALDAALARCTTDNERALARELLAFHRRGIEALVALVTHDALVEAADRDPLLSSALALHGFHPIPAEVRVARALVPLGDVELMAIDDGVPRLRAAATDRAAAAAAIDRALCAAAPDLEPAQIEWIDAPHVPLGRLVPIEDAHETACDRCGAAIGSGHAHALDSERSLACVCAACIAAPGLRVISPRAEPIELALDGWGSVPVDLAFFYRDDASEVVAAYPGPAGIVRGEVALGALRDAVAELEPEVEAVLVRRHRSRGEAHRVSIDVCHRLVALVRREWRGFGGGPRVHAEIDRFFDALSSREAMR